MRRLFFSAGLLAIAALSATAQSFTSGQSADLVLGQATFTSNATVPVNNRSMDGPAGVAVDPTSGKLFVAEYDNNRVLRYANAASLSSNQAAEAVIGQPDFTSNAINQGLPAPTAATLRNPAGVFVDQTGTLYVSDTYNHRVLVYHNASTALPIANATADRVIGQPDFVTGTSGTTASKLNAPYNVWLSAADTLFVADFSNFRVLGFKLISASAANGPAANLVLGQPDFVTRDFGLGATKLAATTDLLVDSGNRLWVADYGNRRVLRFDHADTLPEFGATAAGVLGQSDFDEKVTAVTAEGMDGPIGIAMDSEGSLHVADLFNRRVTIFKNAAALANGAAASIVLGQPNFTSNAAAVTAQGLSGPLALRFDLQGRLLVPDPSANRVLRYTKGGGPTPMPTPPVSVTPTVAVSGKKKITTTKGSLKIKGSTTGTVASVTVKLGKKTKTAKGTSKWNYKAKLKPGKNVLTIVAIGIDGQASAPLKVKITRK